MQSKDHHPERTIIRADPGWFAVMHLIRAGETPETGESWNDHLVLSPIIAWEIERCDEPYGLHSGKPARARLVYHIATPIIAGAAANDGIDHIRRPDGSFVARTQRS